MTTTIYGPTHIVRMTPVDRATFDRLQADGLSDIVGIPTMCDIQALKKAIWPKPDDGVEIVVLLKQVEPK